MVGGRRCRDACPIGPWALQSRFRGAPYPRPMPDDRLTFLGHSTVLIEMDGTRLLTDPVLGHVLWSIRRRAPAVAAHHLDDVDAVFISHGHFDHLDLKSLRALPGAPTVIVPGGLGHIAGRAGLGAGARGR